MHARLREATEQIADLDPKHRGTPTFEWYLSDDGQTITLTLDTPEYRWYRHGDYETDPEHRSTHTLNSADFYLPENFYEPDFYDSWSFSNTGSFNAIKEAADAARRAEAEALAERKRREAETNARAQAAAEKREYERLRAKFGGQG